MAIGLLQSLQNMCLYLFDPWQSVDTRLHNPVIAQLILNSLNQLDLTVVLNTHSPCPSLSLQRAYWP